MSQNFEKIYSNFISKTSHKDSVSPKMQKFRTLADWGGVSSGRFLSKVLGQCVKPLGLAILSDFTQKPFFVLFFARQIHKVKIVLSGRFTKVR
jgi:hypothetical protein